MANLAPTDESLVSLVDDPDQQFVLQDQRKYLTPLVYNPVQHLGSLALPLRFIQRNLVKYYVLEDLLADLGINTPVDDFLGSRASGVSLDACNSYAVLEIGSRNAEGDFETQICVAESLAYLILNNRSCNKIKAWRKETHIPTAHISLFCFEHPVMTIAYEYSEYKKERKSLDPIKEQLRSIGVPTNVLNNFSYENVMCLAAVFANSIPIYLPSKLHDDPVFLLFSSISQMLDQRINTEEIKNGLGITSVAMGRYIKTDYMLKTAQKYYRETNFMSDFLTALGFSSNSVIGYIAAIQQQVQTRKEEITQATIFEAMLSEVAVELFGLPFEVAERIYRSICKGARNV